MANSNDDLMPLLQGELTKILPDAIQTVGFSYHYFIKTCDVDDAKAFGQHHSAAKAALLHLQVLMKMTEWTQTKRAMTKNDRNDALENLLRETHKTLLATDHESDPDDDDDTRDQF